MPSIAGQFNYEPDAPSVPDECYCEDCARFREQIVDVRGLADYYYGEDAAKSLFDAGVCIKEAWARYQYQNPHFLLQEDGTINQRIIVPQSYTRGPREDGSDVREHRQCSDKEDNSSNFEDDDDKFMVCDHCMAHGLPCNEASVCHQCQHYNQPCVHRWCHLSQSSKAACERYSCRYVHEDNMNTRAGDPSWVVLPGKLPKYLGWGRMPRAYYSDDTAAGSAWQWFLEERQKNARTMLEEAVNDGYIGTPPAAGSLTAAKGLLFKAWNEWTAKEEHQLDLVSPDAPKRPRRQKLKDPDKPVSDLKSGKRRRITVAPICMPLAKTELIAEPITIELMCDHCYAHGLPCNDVQACDQCRLFNQPCIYRWCPNGAKDKNKCDRQSCFSIHNDSIQSDNGLPRRVILSGALPPPMCSGLIAPRPFEKVAFSIDWTRWNSQIDARHTDIIENSRGWDGMRGRKATEYTCSCKNETIPWSIPELTGPPCAECGSKSNYYRTCYKCAVRHRIVGDSINCLVCSVPAMFLIFTDGELA
ncbi:uncharacterized protein MYCFIDRAFT_79768 [Pseudocercospora fijiensis CIRAD86]|uniref:Uncharacterized protein n=1 Tax=Pseudocercospora fijiensis (strain CIRAD86) TaxID=383855 RepID=M3APQ6_PSEFD|nr:uncharacterized protein MYCFIDRAFT_79768 [Pseudocercospora fijiensis CIRAD86]EME79108.1 hypothetical protein MYCFIDRAFT_79768 [Pseudocercospora fijiensis CIRAD86]